QASQFDYEESIPDYLRYCKVIRDIIRLTRQLAKITSKNRAEQYWDTSNIFLTKNVGWCKIKIC
ncbi:MAG: hypothetical protein V1749_00400, partial [Candidatus Desantisbacteria bacterium]